MLQLHNSLTKEKQPFEPINPGKIGMYVCGMTVYDYCHIGHGRVFVAFDVITRYLRARGFDVNYVMNITDIDDKIINRAQENNEEVEALTARFIDAMHEDMVRLGVISPDAEPRATEHIPEIIRMIEKLIENDHAYVAENGDVYYDITTFKNYGELAHQKIEQLQSGARVDVLDVKRNPIDFVLWKLAKPGEPKWSSPWGEGRPGWHIECSAMSTELLGKQFDIHGGGIDLVFPHHQNEIAQSEGAHQCAFVNHWMHVGHVQVNREKMSKSLGNFFTIREVLEKYDAEVIRYFMIASHYRSPINYSEANLNSAYSALERFYLALRDLPEVSDHKIDDAFGKEFVERFNDAMDDDFNTPVATSVLFDIVREINRLRVAGDVSTAAQYAGLLKKQADVLGLLYQNPEIFLRRGIDENEVAKIENLIAAREKAREEKNWLEADRLREELAAIGVVLEDSSDGTIWRKE